MLSFCFSFSSFCMCACVFLRSVFCVMPHISVKNLNLSRFWTGRCVSGLQAEHGKVPQDSLRAWQPATWCRLHQDHSPCKVMGEHSATGRWLLHQLMAGNLFWFLQIQIFWFLFNPHLPAPVLQPRMTCCPPSVFFISTPALLLTVHFLQRKGSTQNGRLPSVCFFFSFSHAYGLCLPLPSQILDLSC